MKKTHWLGTQHENRAKKKTLVFSDDSISKIISTLRSPVIQKTIFAKKRYTSIIARVPYCTTVLYMRSAAKPHEQETTKYHSKSA